VPWDGTYIDSVPKLANENQLGRGLRWLNPVQLDGLLPGSSIRDAREADRQIDRYMDIEIDPDIIHVLPHLVRYEDCRMFGPPGIASLGCELEILL